MTTVGLLDRIHRERAYRVDGQLFDAGCGNGHILLLTFRRPTVNRLMEHTSPANPVGQPTKPQPSPIRGSHVAKAWRIPDSSAPWQSAAIANPQTCDNLICVAKTQYRTGNEMSTSTSRQSRVASGDAYGAWYVLVLPLFAENG
jgi:hypothetical protein